MDLVAVGVGDEDLRVVQPGPAGQPRNVEGEEDIDQIGEDHGRNAEGDEALAREQPLDLAANGGRLEAGLGDRHQCAPTRRLR
jgi:hypothetical protein